MVTQKFTATTFRQLADEAERGSMHAQFTLGGATIMAMVSRETLPRARNGCKEQPNKDTSRLNVTSALCIKKGWVSNKTTKKRLNG
jgi:hypothetical protein